MDVRGRRVRSASLWARPRRARPLFLALLLALQGHEPKKPLPKASCVPLERVESDIGEAPASAHVGDDVCVAGDHCEDQTPDGDEGDCCPDEKGAVASTCMREGDGCPNRCGVTCTTSAREGCGRASPYSVVSGGERAVSAPVDQRNSAVASGTCEALSGTARLAALQGHAGHQAAAAALSPLPPCTSEGGSEGGSDGGSDGGMAVASSRSAR